MPLIWRAQPVLGREGLTYYFLRCWNANEAPCQQDICSGCWANLVFTSLLHSSGLGFPYRTGKYCVCGTQEPGANSRYGKISTCSCALAPTPQVSLISLWGQGVARWTWCFPSALVPQWQGQEDKLINPCWVEQCRIVYISCSNLFWPILMVTWSMLHTQWTWG